ncbi:MAG TPA: DCC1-like thiol-disulfide oxidoreductase family protein [Steroidobacteraceae bacterium]|nr:DCC1-like thiol-disulfide oxidoreductase family protein [Steroidobacteraceae bacterium]
MSSTSDEVAAETLWIVYDGECPLCSRFSLLYRAREVARRVCLVDARSHDPLVAEVRARGFDLDAGMVVILGDRFYHGVDAMGVMALLGSDRTLFNRLNRAIFRRPRLARQLYPALVRGRRLLLCLLRRELIGSR